MKNNSLDNPNFISESFEEPIIKKIKSFKTNEGKFSVYDIDDNHRNRGDMLTVWENRNGWIVRNVLVPEELRNKGIATKLYIYLNTLSKAKTGKPLRSSQPRTLVSGEEVHEISEMGQVFWDSLVSKGLATKLGNKDYIMEALHSPMTLEILLS